MIKTYFLRATPRCSSQPPLSVPPAPDPNGRSNVYFLTELANFGGRAQSCHQACFYFYSVGSKSPNAKRDVSFLWAALQCGEMGRLVRHKYYCYGVSLDAMRKSSNVCQRKGSPSRQGSFFSADSEATIYMIGRAIYYCMHVPELYFHM